MIVWILVIGVASYRCWRLFAEDSITQPLRDRIDGWLLEMVECPWCSGFWWAILLTGVTDIWIGLPAPVLVGLGAAVVVGLIGEHA